MNTAVTTTERRSVLIDMASRFGMEAAAFEATLRATVVPKDCSREQFAAFLLVAKEYSLNPLTKEIYAFPTRGGGIQPIVSIDGWCNLINSHPMLNGIEFDDHMDADGKNMSAITARIWRKDRDKPIVVTEYMVECVRSTDPWKQWPRRMLRHKALIQCARYAFGFAGIVDPDEAERMGADVSPMRDVSAKKPPAPTDVVETKVEVLVPSKRPPPPEDNGFGIPPVLDRRPKKVDPAPPTDDPEVFRKWVDDLLASATADNLEAVFNEQVEPHLPLIFPPDADDIMALYRKHEQRLAP